MLFCASSFFAILTEYLKTQQHSKIMLWYYNMPYQVFYQHIFFWKSVIFQTLLRKMQLLRRHIHYFGQFPHGRKQYLQRPWLGGFPYGKTQCLHMTIGVENGNFAEYCLNTHTHTHTYKQTHTNTHTNIIYTNTRTHAHWYKQTHTYTYSHI